MKVLIAGDFCPQSKVADCIEREDYASVLSEVRDITDHVDYSIVNFECPIASCNGKPIAKSGPNLRCTEKGIDAIKWAGFDCVTLANNHFLDYGESGVKETLNVCKLKNIDYVGGGVNLKDASKILYTEVGNKTLAVINCCEHEFSIATEKSAGSNPLNTIQLYYSIKEARGKSDYVIVIVHGGHEHYNLPTPRMVETYRFFIKVGADAVINHHQHCYSGYEDYNGKPIFYGLGNLCFDKLYEGIPSSWFEGYMVELSFGSNQNVEFRLIPYSQCKDKPRVEIMKGEDYKQFSDNIDRYNLVISNSTELEKKHEDWMASNSGSFEFQFLPYNNRWLISAYVRHLFPSLLSKKKILNLQNHIECESHREQSLYAIKRIYNRKK